MYKMNPLRLVLLVALAALLAAGCAKKPAPSPEAAGMGMEQPAVTEMPSEEVAGVQEGAMTEMGVSEEAAPTAALPELQRIFFDFDQYVLTDEARQTLADNAAYLKANSGAEVKIEGHCDERGSDEYNLALGERRALAAKNYLVSLGISPDRLSIISYGEEMPLDPAHDEAAWAKNRRAEFKVVR
jgi:peptidoglycan-associated lipoprotein